MNERVIENWLDKANERSFQIPFCHALYSEKHTIIHMTRHCGMELGKDIIAIAPDKVPCAYQLKGVNGKRLTLSRWRKELLPQIQNLVFGKLVHPSLKPHKHHRAYIVINGGLEEEVQRAIDDFNRARKDEGNPKRQIHLIVKGELLRMFKNLQSGFWPAELVDERTFLELYLEQGNGPLPKQKLASLFESTMSFQIKKGRMPSREKCSRAIASCALLCASAISPFSNRDNHAAEFEAWALYFSYVLGLAERWKLPEKYWKFELDIASKSMYNALGRLCEELMNRSHYVEGDALSDQPFYRVRMTYLLGLMSIYALWRQRMGEDEGDHDNFLREFCLKNSNKIELWGEYAIPQCIVFYFYLRKINPSHHVDFLLLELIRAISSQNKTRGNELSIPDPYYDVDDIFPYYLKLEPKPFEYSFKGSSYSLESLVHLFVRTNFKQHMIRFWPVVSRVAFASFEPKHRWGYYLWRCKEGLNKIEVPPPTQSWNALKAQSLENHGQGAPRLLKKFPMEYLCYLCVYPHRLNSSGIRWIATKLQEDKKSP